MSGWSNPAPNHRVPTRFKHPLFFRRWNTPGPVRSSLYGAGEGWFLSPDWKKEIYISWR